MVRLFRNIKTFRNWYQHYWDRYGFGETGKEVELSLRNGQSIHLRRKTSDFRTARSIFSDHSYLHPPIEIPETGTVIDVGGHIGCFTLFAGGKAGKGRVLVFEPEPANFQLLQKNVQINRLDQVELFPLAVTAEAGEREMFYPKKRTSTGGSSLFREGPESFRVDCTTLPDIFEKQKLEKIDLLKLDCEGAEVEILQTVSDELLHRIRQIVMEIHVPDRMEPVFGRLLQSGFERADYPKKNYAAFFRP